MGLHTATSVDMEGDILDSFIRGLGHSYSHITRVFMVLMKPKSAR